MHGRAFSHFDSNTLAPRSQERRLDIMYGVIYKLTNKLNGKPYVGQTKQKLHRRMEQHKVSNSAIGNAIRKYGLENFMIEVIEECETLEQLNEREMFWIAYFNSKCPNGYNLTDGGDGSPGWSCSDETRAKMSLSHMGNKYSLGYHHTDETRMKMSLAQTGEKNHFFGKHHTAESMARASATKRGQTPYKNLIAAMDEHSFSYMSLAKLLGLIHQTVSDKMTGKQNFTATQIAKLVEIFGLPADYLMARDDGCPFITSRAELGAKSSSAQRLDSSYKNLLREIDNHRLSYNRLAKLLGLARKTVSDKMRGEYNFTAKDIAKLVEIFGKPADYLLST